MFNFFKKNEIENESVSAVKLEKVLSLADQIINTNPKAIKQFVALLGRKYQSEYMVKLASAYNEHKVPKLDPQVVWFSEFTQLNAAGDTLHSIKKKLNIDVTLKLSCDMVLPWPWDTERIVKNLSYIGKGKVRGDWFQDNNHKVELWLPFGLGWVHGGNHSIASGILQGDGIIKPTNIYDVSSVFDLVKFDGNYFIRIEDGERISNKVVDFEFAAVFEVGRLIHKKDLNLYTS